MKAQDITDILASNGFVEYQFMKRETNPDNMSALFQHLLYVKNGWAVIVRSQAFKNFMAKRPVPDFTLYTVIGKPNYENPESIMNHISVFTEGSFSSLASTIEKY